MFIKFKNAYIKSVAEMLKVLWKKTPTENDTSFMECSFNFRQNRVQCGQNLGELKMNISVIGTGYVGLVSGVCFSDFGFNVTCVDNDAKKIEDLHKCLIPIYEPGLEDLLKKNADAGRLKFTTSCSNALKNADIVFIAVGTPMSENGSADLQYVFSAANEIADSIKEDAVLVVKSTVPVGTTAKVKEILQKKGKQNSVAFNPEFLKEGAAVQDFMYPDRIILGVDDEHAKNMLFEIYKSFNDATIAVSRIESAELSKYCENAFLAMKVSFINQVADLCGKCGANIDEVAYTLGLDKRIGNKFLQPGPGYGGSCFPKDTNALNYFSKHQFGVDMSLVSTTISYNEARKKAMVNKIIDSFDGTVSGKKIAVLGLTFKANTDDMRASSSLVIVPGLAENGAKIVAFDPKAENVNELLKNIKLADNIYDACKDVDGIVVITEWDEFKNADLKKIKTNMKGNTVVDLRNIYNPYEMEMLGYRYFSIGR